MNKFNKLVLLLVRAFLVLLFTPSLVFALTCPVPVELNSSSSSETNKSDQSENSISSFTHQFDSGARWEFCWHIDDYAGLTISNIHFGPPAEQSTKMLETASLAQILFKYDEDVVAQHILSIYAPVCAT